MSVVIENTTPPTIHHPVEHEHDHAAEHENIKVLGFWIFLATDLILFACLFATYLVLRTHTDGGPSGHSLFDVPMFTAETFLLLTSSFTGGLAVYEMKRGHRNGLIVWLIVTVLLGLGFVGLEVNEFVHMALDGATMQRSGFLSGFFTLVGTHGCHVSLGIVWMCLTIYQLYKRGINAVTFRKVFIVGIYWHFLDVVWVFIFSVVYIPGVVS